MADCYTKFLRIIRDLPAGEERRLAIWLLYEGATKEKQDALAHLALVQELRDLEDTLANYLLEPWAGATAVERIEQIFTELLEDEEDNSSENNN